MATAKNNGTAGAITGSETMISPNSVVRSEGLL